GGSKNFFEFFRIYYLTFRFSGEKLYFFQYNPNLLLSLPSFFSFFIKITAKQGDDILYTSLRLTMLSLPFIM
ncbi:MAG: hypothetical protein LUE92_11885, partial [Clostridiales bacterium]|nr:hypothetical protein [Clostridiales bacterium]